MAIDIRLMGHEKDLGGGFLVRRLLPDARQRSVGPFIFFDHFGPALERPDVNHDVRPHPRWPKHCISMSTCRRARGWNCRRCPPRLRSIP